MMPESPAGLHLRVHRGQGEHRHYREPAWDPTDSECKVVICPKRIDQYLGKAVVCLARL